MLLKIDDRDEVAVGSFFTDARVSINRDKRFLSVRSRDDFVAGNASDIDCEGLVSRYGIDEAKVMVALIDHE